MFAPGLIQGRWLGAEDFEALQRLIAEHPHWSRRQLSIALCEALNWRTASGQLKDMSARLLLNKLAQRGWIKLPPRQRSGGRQILRAWNWSRSIDFTSTVTCRSYSTGLDWSAFCANSVGNRPLHLRCWGRSPEN